MARFQKAERICSEKEISRLFREGRSIRVDQLGFRFLLNENPDWPRAKFLIVVPKKRIRTAVLRNRIKRRLREIVRLKKHQFYEGILPANNRLYLAVIYFGNTETDFSKLTASYDRLTELLEKKVNKN
jgi:ribonuclease P protein component